MHLFFFGFDKFCARSTWHVRMRWHGFFLDLFFFLGLDMPAGVQVAPWTGSSCFLVFSSVLSLLRASSMPCPFFFFGHSEILSSGLVGLDAF